MGETVQPQTGSQEPDYIGPFVGELQDTELTTHQVLREIDGVQDVLVRVGGSERLQPPELVKTVDEETGATRWRMVEKAKYSPEIHAKYVAGLALFKERGEPPYDIAYARTSAVAAKDPLDNVDKMMLVTEKVTGVPLSETLQHAPDDPKLADQISAWLDGSSQYLLDKSQTGGDFLFDFDMRQYMYGVTPSAPDEPRIYDIDLDMLFEHFGGMAAPGESTDGAAVSLGSAFIDLGRAINMIDKIGESATPGDDARPAQQHVEAGVEPVGAVIDTTAAKTRVKQFIASIPQDTQPDLYSMTRGLEREFPWLLDEDILTDDDTLQPA
jgi:hypothetical protein